ncbi:MAG: transglutaminase domain-containing protein [Thermodesulfobacteriota bacterium]
MSKKKAIALALVLVALAALFAYVFHSRVKNGLTPADIAALRIAAANLHLAPIPADAGYASQIALIGEAQKAVLSLAPKNDGIPEGSPREPADLFAQGSGLCYDRSRSLEKLLRYLGFSTRHVSVYTAPQNGWAYSGLFRGGTPSHAVSEVLTRKGWLLLDSNAPWMALTAAGDPMSARAMAQDAEKHSIAWQDPGINPIFRKRFVYIYGLYSRHGRFYPPYNPVPDINWPELAENF